ncbi:hypothetical protein ACPDHL_07350 [Myroides sp. C15-4]|uniref:hypothetical protein n=1 Tax=Myroides sp. C15-4 TaxID=3400532 RepID=UPI003D2F740F
MHLISIPSKPLCWALFTLTLGILFSSCSDLKEIDNKYLTIQVPKDYMDMTDFDNEDVLFLDRLGEDGLESILSIDNEVDFLTQPNSQTIQEDTPVEVLARRLRSIEDSAENDSDFPWTRFRLVEEAKAITFKGLPAAEGVFEVQEYMKRTDQVVTRRVKRIVIFMEDDLWNIVLAPSRLQRYTAEMEVFEQALESMVIKN